MHDAKHHQSHDAFAIFFGESGQESKKNIVHDAQDLLSDIPQQEGKLAIDILEDKDTIYVVSTMAGALPERIEVYVRDDVLTIRGVRTQPFEGSGERVYVHKENYYGTFSRTVILPVDVKEELANAEYKNGILSISIPKKHSDGKIPIRVVDE